MPAFSSLTRFQKAIVLVYLFAVARTCLFAVPWKTPYRTNHYIRTG